MSTAISAENITFQYEPQEGKLAVPVFEDLSLSPTVLRCVFLFFSWAALICFGLWPLSASTARFFLSRDALMGIRPLDN